MASMSGPNTPKGDLATPLRLTKRRYNPIPPETPECYTKVTVETPGVAKPKKRDKCDEVRNLAVAVRIRPMNSRELSCTGATNVVQVKDQSVVIRCNSGSSAANRVDYVFPYDHVFWSCDQSSVMYASQKGVFSKIGQPLLHNAFRGYNGCLFAYGQTGSGKSYSMMGPDAQDIDCNSGIIPRFCHELFTQLAQLDNQCTASVDVSYFEIYNEKIHDLLLSNCSREQHTPLKVREHPDWGPYVVNLTSHTVKSYEEMRSWLLLGNENRATAATVMNEKSSRSHSIFSVELSILEGMNENDPGRRSKVSLVDLAGSERLGGSTRNDEKLKEGVSINKSLLTLGKVICALADQRKGSQFVPYRESVLTWLLRESLGGNSLTCMLATISPASAHLDETLATLRYACQARSIVNRARINEEPHDRLIRELRSEVERLTALRQEYERSSFLSSSIQIDNSMEQEMEDLRNKLSEKEDELKMAQESWENRYKESYQHQMQQLAEMQRRKDELESRVRIMSNIKDEVDLSPYRTNFLEEVENILTTTNGVNENFADKYGKWLRECGFDYQLVCNKSETILNILNSNSSQKASCHVNDIKDLKSKADVQNFIKRLCWENSNESLTEAQIVSTMNKIYDTAKFLKPHIDKEEKLRLAFAKFIKAAQVLESTMCSSVNVNKSKKAVSFRL